MQRGVFKSRTKPGPAGSEPAFPETSNSTPALPFNEAPTSNSNSAFFRLSAEIQQNILSEAFGNLIVHLELDGQDGQWHVRGFVCARSPALTEPEPDAGPANDLCLDHLAQTQSLAKKPLNFQAPEHGYQIGAMGWLLSCKQAYMSGMRILYGNSKFHIADKDLSSRLSLFLPPHGVQYITRAEIVLTVDYVKPQEHSDYHTQLELLPNTFSHLRQLDMSFKCRLLSPAWLAQQADQREAIENILLLPLDAMVRKLKPHCLVNVAFPPSLWIPMMGRARRTTATELIVEWAPRPPGRPRGHGDRFWRPIPSTTQVDSGNHEATTVDNCNDDANASTNGKANAKTEATTDITADEPQENSSTTGPTGYWLESGFKGEFPVAVSCHTAA